MPGGVLGAIRLSWGVELGWGLFVMNRAVGVLAGVEDVLEVPLEPQEPFLPLSAPCHLHVELDVVIVVMGVQINDSWLLVMLVDLSFKAEPSEISNMLSLSPVALEVNPGPRISVMVGVSRITFKFPPSV